MKTVPHVSPGFLESVRALIAQEQLHLGKGDCVSQQQAQSIYAEILFRLGTTLGEPRWNFRQHRVNSLIAQLLPLCKERVFR
jgi:hypothetical protein